jgi:RNA polymerase sigma-B factor
MTDSGNSYSRIHTQYLFAVLLSISISMATLDCGKLDQERAVEPFDHLAVPTSRNGSRTAERNRLIETNLPLVRALARRYVTQADTFDDLVQAGTIGLIKAVDGFRPDRGRNLAAYAVPTIIGELRRHRERSWVARASTGRSSTAAIQVVLDDTALEAPMSDLALERGENRIFLRTCFRALTKRERRIVALRFYRDLSEARIGAEIGLSQVQVSRVLKSSLEKMRNALEPR